VRRCYACERDKPAEEFARDRSKAHGHSSICRACDRARSRRYYEANRERVNARVKAARPPAPTLMIVCQGCGELFEGTSRWRYFKPGCYPRSARGKKTTALCEGCGRPFEARLRDRVRGGARFCSKRCASRSGGSANGCRWRHGHLRRGRFRERAGVWILGPRDAIAIGVDQIGTIRSQIRTIRIGGVSARAAPSYGPALRSPIRPWQRESAWPPRACGAGVRLRLRCVGVSTSGRRALPCRRRGSCGE
jgi:hypothetical protein